VADAGHHTFERAGSDRVTLVVGTLGQALQRVLTHRFKKPIARLGRVIFALHERSIDQPSERIEDVFDR